MIMKSEALGATYCVMLLKESYFLFKSCGLSSYNSTSSDLVKQGEFLVEVRAATIQLLKVREEIM